MVSRSERPARAVIPKIHQASIPSWSEWLPSRKQILPRVDRMGYTLLVGMEAGRVSVGINMEIPQT